jgi:hypothetical protein
MNNGTMNLRTTALVVIFMATFVDGQGADSAKTLLQNAADAFVENDRRAMNFTWLATSTHRLVTASGKPIRIRPAFPDVYSETFIEGNRRCEAVTGWSDRKVPYGADRPDARCSAEAEIRSQNRDAFSLLAILQANSGRLTGRASDGSFQIYIAEDPSRRGSPDTRQRCAASIRADVTLDPSSFFPKHVEGTVAGDGCESGAGPSVSVYGPSLGPSRPMIRKGYRFEETFLLQDQANDPAKSYWLLIRNVISVPLEPHAGFIGYSGRQFPFSHQVFSGDRLENVVIRRAKEFAATSDITFERN